MCFQEELVTETNTITPKNSNKNPNSPDSPDLTAVVSIPDNEGSENNSNNDNTDILKIPSSSSSSSVSNNPTNPNNNAKQQSNHLPGEITYNNPNNPSVMDTTTPVVAISSPLNSPNSPNTPRNSSEARPEFGMSLSGIETKVPLKDHDNLSNNPNDPNNPNNPENLVSSIPSEEKEQNIQKGNRNIGGLYGITNSDSSSQVIEEGYGNQEIQVYPSNSPTPREEFSSIPLKPNNFM